MWPSPDQNYQACRDLDVQVLFRRLGFELIMPLLLFFSLSFSFPSSAQTEKTDNRNHPASESDLADLPQLGDVLEVMASPQVIEEEEILERDRKISDSENPDLASLLSDESVSPKLSLRNDQKLLDRFVAARRVILRTLYRLMSPLNRNREKLMMKLNKVDAFIQESAQTISGKTRSGFFFTLSLSGGFGLTQKILDKIKHPAAMKAAQYLPKFYYLMGTGAAILKSSEDGVHQKLRVVLISDFDRLENVHSFVAEVSFALNYGYGVEVEDLSKDLIKSHNVGILGTTKQSENHFSHNFTMGAALPPGLPAWMVYSNQTHRYYLTILKIPWFKQKSKSLTCSSALLG